MLTEAGKKGISGLFVWSRASSQYIQAKNMSGSSADCYRIFNSEYNYATANGNPFSSSGYGIAPGSSIEEPDETEYTVPSTDRNFAGLIYVTSEVSCTDAKYIRYTYQNKSTDNISVNCTYCTAYNFLVDHTKLETPIIVEPNQKVIFTYKLGLI